MYVLSAIKKAPPKNYTNPRRILLGFRFHADEAGSGKIFHPRQRKMPCKDGAKNNNPRNWLLCEEFRHNKFRVWLLHCDCPHRDACFYSNYLIIIVDSMVWKKFKFHGRIRKESVNSFDCVSWKYRMTCLFLCYLVREPTSVIFFLSFVLEGFFALLRSKRWSDRKCYKDNRSGLGFVRFIRDRKL